MCVVFNMNSLLLCLHFIAILIISIKCDLIYFENETLTNLLHNVEMSNSQSCATPQGVTIVMIGTSNTRLREVGCKGAQNIPIDQIAVKHLISQANDINNSSQLIYLANADGELTQGNGNVWRNLSFREWGCILSQHSVAVLKPNGVNIENFSHFRPPSLQTVLMAEYMNNNGGGAGTQRRQGFSITPSVRSLVNVVSYFIMKTGWTRIGLLYDSTDYRLSERFTNAAERMAFQVFPMKYDGSNANDIYHYFRNNNIRIIAYAGLVRTYLQALDDLYDYYYTGIG